MIVETRAALEASCNHALKAGAFVCMDTEFLRERTYRADLCLVQMATASGEIYCVDPLPMESLNPLREICECASLTKIFHAARQDLEVLYQNLGVVPQPVFDTQLAAAFCGMGDQLGYAPLVAQVTGVELAKTQTRTDWLRRPLGDAQVRYAEEDVRYLEALYDHLCEQLDKLGRVHWLHDDLQRMVNVELYEMLPADAWQRVRGASNLSGARQSHLFHLAAWRERVANDANLPREWVVKDKALIELVRSDDIDDGVLADAGLTRKQIHQWGDAIADAMQEPEVDLSSSVVPRLTSDDEKRRKRLMSVLQERAQELGVSPSLLGSRRDVEHFIVAPDKSSLNSGWRWDIIGEHLTDIP